MAARRLLLPLLAVAGSLAFPAAAEIKTESFREDPRASIMFEKFGFSKSGAVRIVVTGAAVSSPVARADPKQLGFFLLSDESLLYAIDEAQEGPSREKRAAATNGGGASVFSGGRKKKASKGCFAKRKKYTGLSINIKFPTILGFK